MARHDVDAARVASDQLVEAPPRFHRRVTIVGERQQASRVLPAHADEIGDPVHQHARLARSRSREHQHVGAFPVVGNDPLLGSVAEALDDRFVVLGQRIAPECDLLVLEPLADELVLRELEVVDREAERQMDVVDAEPRVLGDHMDLLGLLGVVLLQRSEVRNGEGPAVPRDLQRHRVTEHGQAAVEGDDLLLVHPEKRAVDQRLGLLVLQLRLQYQVVPDRLFERAVSRLDQQIDAANSVRHLAEEMVEKPGRAVPANPRNAIDAGPVST